MTRLHLAARALEEAIARALDADPHAPGYAGRTTSAIRAHVDDFAAICMELVDEPIEAARRNALEGK